MNENERGSVIVQIPLEDIIVKKRIRKDVGDVSSLADSIRRFGLINPIVINKRNVLIAGRRRLEAVRNLGWRTVNAAVIDSTDELNKLEFELEENLHRQDLSLEEIAKANDRIRKLRHPGVFRKLWNNFVRFLKRLFRLD